MILGDKDIKYRLSKAAPAHKYILVSGEGFDPAVQVQPASLDLRLGPGWRRPVGFLEAPVVHLRDKAAIDKLFNPPVNDDHTLVLRPMEFVLGRTLEYIEMPTDLRAVVKNRSTTGRAGIAVHALADYIDPGYKGVITLAIVNLGPFEVHIDVGDRLCQLEFAQTSCEAQYDGKYQGSTEAATARGVG